MRGVVMAAVLAAAAGGAFAQEAMFTEAATMPSPGVFVVRQQFNFFRFGQDPDSGAKWTERYESMTSVSYGLARALAVRLDIPAEYRVTRTAGGHNDSDKGVSDLELMFKYRFYKDDTGGVDTVRAALIGGASFASGDDRDFSSGSVNPHIGAVLTIVRGRHGFDQDLIYRFNTGGDETNFGGDGPADALKYDSAYLFRIYPEAFTADSKGAWYATAELNGLYETNGDNEIRFSPGLMYEGWTFAFELMAQLPLVEDVRHRAEFDFAVGVGLRVSF